MSQATNTLLHSFPPLSGKPDMQITEPAPRVKEQRKRDLALTPAEQRPFEGNSESSLSSVIQAGKPKFPVTNPPVSLPCMYAIQAALEVDPHKRLGHTWDSFIFHEFFSVIDFAALERKEIEPVFVPSSEKTNFDATYDLEELLLEEAPLEARARRQKPRERLKEDATDKEIREDELYRMIETDFRPFDYTVAAYKKYVSSCIFFSPPSLLAIY